MSLWNHAQADQLESQVRISPQKRPKGWQLTHPRRYSREG